MGDETTEDERPLFQRAEENLKVKLEKKIAWYNEFYSQRGIPIPSGTQERIKRLQFRVDAISKRYGSSDG